MDNLTKRLIWLYFFLLVGEGILRKWVAPDLSNPLLIIRDPVVILIYFNAFMNGRFPMRLSILAIAGLAMGSLVLATLSATDPIVALYGLRTNYLHIPLIFIMADQLNRHDVLQFGRAVLWLTIPIGLLMIAQYIAGEHSWLNAGAGGERGGQLRGALGRIRPPGPFTFITGPVLWFSLATAFTFHGWLNREIYPRILLIAVTSMIVIIIPVSVSRMLMFSVFVVLAFGLVSLVRNPRQIFIFAIPAILIMGTFSMIDGGTFTSSFESRWNSSTKSGLGDSIFGRYLQEHMGWMDHLSKTPLEGYGIGLGSNVGARLTSGRAGFLLAESEWTKIILELGPLLGTLFIVYRIGLAGQLFLKGVSSLFIEKNSLPWLICGACILPVFSGQWAPPTILGFAVFGAGLTLAASNIETDDDDEEFELEEESLDEA